MSFTLGLEYLRYNFAKIMKQFTKSQDLIFEDGERYTLSLVDKGERPIVEDQDIEFSNGLNSTGTGSQSLSAQVKVRFPVRIFNQDKSVKVKGLMSIGLKIGMDDEIEPELTQKFEQIESFTCTKDQAACDMIQRWIYASIPNIFF